MPWKRAWQATGSSSQTVRSWPALQGHLGSRIKLFPCLSTSHLWEDVQKPECGGFSGVCVPWPVSMLVSVFEACGLCYSKCTNTSFF